MTKSNVSIGSSDVFDRAFAAGRCYFVAGHLVQLVIDLFTAQCRINALDGGDDDA